MPQSRFNPSFDDHTQAKSKRRHVGADDRVAMAGILGHEAFSRQRARLALRQPLGLERSSACTTGGNHRAALAVEQQDVAID